MHLLSFAIMVIFVFASANGITFPEFGMKIKMRLIECIPNENFLTNTSCYFKAKRGTGGMVYLKTHLKQRIKDANAHIETHRWYNGYVPFVVNYTYDMCRIFTKKASMRDRILAKFLEMNSNLNHSCPYEGDVIINGTEADISAIPSFLENGRYRLTLNFSCPDLKAFLFSGRFTVDIS